MQETAPVKVYYITRRRLLKTISPAKLKLILLLIVLVILPWLFYDTFVSSSSWENPPEMIGTRDLIAFWGGVQVFMKGGNPYDFGQLLAVQKVGLPTLQSEQYFLNPPWAIPIFLPFMVWPFQVSRILWFLFNALAFVLPSELLHRSLKLRRITALNITISFLPGIMMLWYGQLSFMIYISLLLGFLAYKAERNILAGLLWIPCTLKPHLVYLTGVVLIISILSERKWKILISAACGLGVLNLFVLYFDPAIFHEYASLDKTPIIYKSSTIPTVVRMIWLELFEYNPSWPVFALPLIAALLVAAQRIAAIQRMKIDSPQSGKRFTIDDLCFYTSLSLSLAPYAWMYDYSLLVIVQIVMFARSRKISAPLRNFPKAVIAIVTVLFMPIFLLHKELAYLEYGILSVFFISMIYVSFRYMLKRSGQYQTIFLITMIQLSAVVTGIVYRELLSFIWFPWAMLIAWITVSTCPVSVATDRSSSSSL